MNIQDLVYDVIVEEVKNKKLFNFLLKKWFGDSPTPEQIQQAEADLTLFMEKQKSLTINNPAVYTFLMRHDGTRGLPAFDPSKLMDISQYSLEEIEMISQMEIEVNQKMKMIGLKSSQSFGVEVTKKEIFSETQFRSFKHFGDDRYVKIISFVVFYCLLKVNKPYLKALGEEKIKDILMNSEYFYRVDKDIINIYFENNEVFDTILEDHMEGSW
mgnify:CR=1 FL=1